MRKAIIVSGYFNPIHKGHLEYFKNAKQHADYLFVIVNSDLQRELKGSKPFQDEEERMIIIIRFQFEFTYATFTQPLRRWHGDVDIDTA